MANQVPFYLRSPYGYDGAGRTARSNESDHLCSLIEAVLFTTPGERVNRPDFGSGLNQLIFSPAGDELATATQFLVQSALQRWLGELIVVEAVQVNVQESIIVVTVQYTVRRGQQRQVQVFQREASA